MSNVFAQQERQELCLLFDEVGPEAPTLCEGWLSDDLAAHLWLRETDPIVAVGIMLKPLAGVARWRMEACKAKHSYPELVEMVRRGPARFSPFALPGVDEQANTLEYFIHHEDLRRGVDPQAQPRVLPSAMDDWLWKRVGGMGMMLRGKQSHGVIVQRSGGLGVGNQHVRLRPGVPITTLIGEPGELLLWLYGRRAHAHITQVGPQL